MKTIYILLAMLALINISCEKWLDAKPDKRLTIPTKLAELQGLMDFHARVNEMGSPIGELYGDNFYITDQDYNSQREDVQRRYRWAPDYIFGSGANDWSYEYDNVFRANTVIDNIDAVDVGNYTKENVAAVLGHAYFLRAEAFMNAVSIWSKAYDPHTASDEMGIPLRLNSDINEESLRANLADTYEEIIANFKRAAKLLPERQITKFRPIKAAAYGYLARTYLWMNDYRNAELYADSCLLSVDVAIMDFNSIDGTINFPFERFNVEVVYEKRMVTPVILAAPRGIVNEDLYNSYPVADLRRELFFSINTDGRPNFRGSYEGVANLFVGLTWPEVLLTQAEAKARNGKTEEAKTILETFLTNRYSDDSYVMSESVTAEEMIDAVLIERRKELAFRGQRFMDIKRLNILGYNIVQQRVINGTSHTLTPNSNAYALPIPEEIIQLSSIEQNPK